MTVKERVRLHHAGQTTFRRIAVHGGWGGPYGQTEIRARWACIHCGRTVQGENDRPHGLWHPYIGDWEDVCARNGHAPCQHCGATLPRLNDGCPREHRWDLCPAKDEGHRMQPRHAGTDCGRTNP